MQRKMLYYWRSILVAVSAAAVLGSLATGCSGSAASQLSSPGAEQSATPNAVLGQLPSPAAIVRQAGMIPNPLMCPGSQYQHSFPNQNLTDMGSDVVFSPQAIGGTFALPSAAFAIYQYQETDLDFLSRSARVVLRGMNPGPPTGTRIFAALGWSGAWHWCELLPDTSGAQSWSFAYSPQWGGFSQGQTGELVPAVIVMFGGAPVTVSELDLIPDDTSQAAGPAVFRKGWDGTIKGRTDFTGSVRVVGDGLGQLHFSYYDSSNGQLYYMRLHDRILTTEAVDCNSDTGLFNDMVLDSAGSPILAWYDPQGQDGEIGDIIDGPSGMTWSAPSVFDAGDNPAGGPKADVGQHCALILDSVGDPHIFYNDLDNGRIKHAWKPAGSMAWVNEVVSQPGEEASNPVPLLGANGLCCAFVVNSHTGPFDLVVAQQGGPTGWIEDVVATDVQDPRAGSTDPGFCDGSVRPGTDEAVLAYSSLQGVHIIHRDLAARNTLSAIIIEGTVGGGVFIKMAMMGDGSAFVSHYNPASGMIAIIRESPSVPAVQVPAVQFPTGVECDDQDLWVSPDDIDGDGFHDLALLTLTDMASISGNKTRELTGHVTLIK